jgi:hypothetical protein
MAKTLGESPESLWTQRTPGLFLLATIPEASLISSVCKAPTCLPLANIGKPAQEPDDKVAATSKATLRQNTYARELSMLVPLEKNAGAGMAQFCKLRQDNRIIL